jgi:hypothetical protein
VASSILSQFSADSVYYRTRWLHKPNVYDAAGKLIEVHKHKEDFKEP